jgi:hypothetical protein
MVSASRSVSLQHPEKPLDVLRPDRLDTPPAERVMGVGTPDALLHQAEFGARDGIRTHDLRITSALLYH